MDYLIGDVQGCDDALGRLLSACGFSPSRDHLVLLGDLVNRGPASLAVLRRLRALEGSATCLLGNHDLHLLAVAEGVRKLHRGDTFGDILDDPGRESWLAWLRERPLAHEASGWLCVHAGVPPQWDAAQTLAHASEVQAVLRGEQFGDFIRAMYGDEPARWDDALAGQERLRFIVNALTRVRFVEADGALEFKTKEGAEAAPAGCVPWFDAPERRTAGTPIAFGHWSTLGRVERPALLALDTGCVWGGCLSAVRVDGGRRERFEVRCEAAQRPG
ncbi:MAG: symmetrical bis(5'-nucleosyl)-tetraphosphatase [Rubrivivax sp.]